MELTNKQKEELQKVIQAELDKQMGVEGAMDSQDLFDLLLFSGSIVVQPLMHEFLKPDNFLVPGEKQQSYKKYKDQATLEKEKKIKPIVKTEKIESPGKVTTTTTITVNNQNYDLGKIGSRLTPEQLQEIRKTFSSEEAFEGYVEFLESPSVGKFFKMMSKKNK